MQACNEPEADAWRAEADGLRDAVMNRNHSDDYRLCSPEIRERYLLGLQDGIVMLQATRVQHTNHAAPLKFHTQLHGRSVGHDRRMNDELPTMQWARSY